MRRQRRNNLREVLWGVTTTPPVPMNTLIISIPPMEPKLVKTTNYKQFVKMKGNRDIDPGNIWSLRQSIMAKNLLSIPIVVNDKMEVVDGQHRLTIAEELKLPLYYLKLPGLTIDDVIRLNSYGKKWAFMDYVNTHAAYGRKQYVRIKEYISMLGNFPPSNVIFLVGKYPRGNRRPFKDGTIELLDHERCIELVSQINEIATYTVPGVVNSKRYARTISQFVRREGYDHERFIERLKLSGKGIGYRGTESDYTRQFEDIYAGRYRS